MRSLLVPPPSAGRLRADALGRSRRGAAMRQLRHAEALLSRLGAGRRRLVLERLTVDHMARPFHALHHELLS